MEEVRGTKLQAGSEEWHLCRRGKITGSKAGDVAHAILVSQGKVPAYKTCRNSHSAAARKVLGLGRGYRNVAMTYGSCNEFVAKRDLQCLYPDYRFVMDIGFVQSVEYPWMGCSPDGLCIFPNGERILVEIKCPFRFRGMPDKTPGQCIKDHDLRNPSSRFFLCKVGGRGSRPVKWVLRES